MENQTQTAHPGPAIGELHEVRGWFTNSEQMQAAIQRLSASGFDRADLAVPETDAPSRRSTPESGALPADTEDDARQARTLHTSTAAAVAALAGAGITVATGGAAAPAVAAALAAGAAAGGATFRGQQRCQSAGASGIGYARIAGAPRPLGTGPDCGQTLGGRGDPPQCGRYRRAGVAKRLRAAPRRKACGQRRGKPAAAPCRIPAARSCRKPFRSLPARPRSGRPLAWFSVACGARPC